MEMWGNIDSGMVRHGNNGWRRGHRDDGGGSGGDRVLTGSVAWGLR